jgi:hypothetical protein
MGPSEKPGPARRPGYEGSGASHDETWVPAHVELFWEAEACQLAYTAGGSWVCTMTDLIHCLLLIAVQSVLAYNERLS